MDPVEYIQNEEASTTKVTKKRPQPRYNSDYAICLDCKNIKPFKDFFKDNGSFLQRMKSCYNCRCKWIEKQKELGLIVDEKKDEASIAVTSNQP